MRIVADTNVWVSGLSTTGPPHEVILRIEGGLDLAFISKDLLVEIMRVVTYPEVLNLLNRANLSPSDALEWVVRHTTLIQPKPLPEVVVTDDPDDDMVLACADATRADFIVSGDAHLLGLKRFRDIPIAMAREYLDHIALH